MANGRVQLIGCSIGVSLAAGVLIAACAPDVGAVAPNKSASSPWHSAPMSTISAPTVVGVESAHPKAEPEPVVVFGPAGGMRQVRGPSATNERTKSVDWESLRPQLNALVGAARRCYVRALRSDPSLELRLGVRVQFDADGSVSSAAAIPVGVGDDLSNCVGTAARQLNAGPGESGREITIPFVFLPRS